MMQVIVHFTLLHCSIKEFFILNYFSTAKPLTGRLNQASLDRTGIAQVKTFFLPIVPDFLL